MRVASFFAGIGGFDLGFERAGMNVVFQCEIDSLEIALQLLTRLDTEHQAWIEENRQQIAVGIAELDRGEGIDKPTAMNQYLQQFQAAREALPS